jgi:hypothetical protein
MKRFLMLSIVLLAFLPGAYLYACSGFCISKGDTVLVGNNEDMTDPHTKVFYVPAEKGKYGGVYFGFDLPEGGMNEKGLVYDGFSAPPKRVKNSLDKPVFDGYLIKKVMEECATVNEVLEIFGKYNLAFMERYMLFFADANGDSAIIEGDTVLRKKGKYQVVTNFRQSETRKEDINIICGRYPIATAMLENADAISVDLAKRVLAATHNEGPSPTLYSNVYDLKRKIVYLYHFHNYQNEVVIDLKAELAKGARTIDLPDLFPKTFVAENFKNSSKGELEKRKAKYTHNVKVGEELLNTYTGQYQRNTPEGSLITFKISTADGKLFSEVEGVGKGELLAASNNDFAIILGEQIINVTFVRHGNEEVEKMRIVDGGQVFYANRVK